MTLYTFTRDFETTVALDPNVMVVSVNDDPPEVSNVGEKLQITFYPATVKTSIAGLGTTIQSFLNTKRTQDAILNGINNSNPVSVSSYKRLVIDFDGFTERWDSYVDALTLTTLTSGDSIRFNIKLIISEQAFYTVSYYCILVAPVDPTPVDPTPVDSGN